VIAPSRKLLDERRARYGNPETGIMFQTRKVTLLSMNNLQNDQIVPALEKCAHCSSSKVRMERRTTSLTHLAQGRQFGRRFFAIAK
jgi:hypothetical protein